MTLRELEQLPCICPECGGDGKETCTNPDHGFIPAVGGETWRLGCPVCGHDPKHKVKKGGPCDICNGAGEVTLVKAIAYCEDDFLDIMEHWNPETFNELVAARDQILKEKGAL